MPNRYKMINNKLVQLTDKEEAVKVAEEKAWNDDAPNRRMIELRRQRDVLLAETDWRANSDVTMSTAWKNYRQALRDITTQTPTDDTLSNITFPTKPSE
tara:strand:+ start:626 stop:922 length:297 start_codon:yes stop_codon:yes gene_type:complete